MGTFHTLKYEQWEDMMRRFEQPLKVFSEVYDQSYFERVGLRYVDAIKRSELGLEGVEWKELIKPHLLGLIIYFTKHFQGLFKSSHHIFPLFIL